MIYTTLNKIREHYPCTDGWQMLLTSLGKTKADDEPIPITHILESNGIDDTLWCLRTLPEYDDLWRLYAVWCARQVQHLMPDKRSLKALDVAEKYAKGNATKEELRTARTAARAAWDAARAAWDAAAWDPAASDADSDAAAWDPAASDADSDAARAAWDAARAAAWDAARAAARVAAWEAQKAELCRIFNETAGDIT